MIAADRVIGVIGIENPERENAYSQDDVRLLATIASWGATAIENARLLGETRQSVQELTALHEVSVALTGSLDTTDIQHIVASGALELFKAEVCAIYLLDRERQITQQIILDTRDPANIDRRINLAAKGMTQRCSTVITRCSLTISLRRWRNWRWRPRWISTALWAPCSAPTTSPPA